VSNQTVCNKSHSQSEQSFSKNSYVLGAKLQTVLWTNNWVKQQLMYGFIIQYSINSYHISVLCLQVTYQRMSQANVYICLCSCRTKESHFT